MSPRRHGIIIDWPPHRSPSISAKPPASFPVNFRPEGDGPEGGGQREAERGGRGSRSVFRQGMGKLKKMDEVEGQMQMQSEERVMHDPHFLRFAGTAASNVREGAENAADSAGEPGCYRA